MKKLITLKSSEGKSAEQLSGEVMDVAESKGLMGRQTAIEVLSYRRWLIIPAGILLTLWLFKSILAAFVVGLGIAIYLDKQSIKAKGLNRLVTLSLLYVIGFSIFTIVLLKITNPVAPDYGIFYSLGESELFFDRYTYRDILRNSLLRGL